jgi:hypothetical protein
MKQIVILAALLQASPADRAYEGDWFVSDSTDNNTGEREVYAFIVHFARADPDYVTLTMRCSKGNPTIFVEWQDRVFPNQTVLTIGPISVPETDPAEAQYVFEKSHDSIERGLRASPETSKKIISALGDSKYTTLTAHLASGSRTITLEVDGTQRAWNRVSRHCPIQLYSLPPI